MTTGVTGPIVVAPPLPALVRGRVHHQRRMPIPHRVRARTYQWLVDVDDLPDHGVLGHIRAADHFGSGTDSLRAGIERFIMAQGAELEPGLRLLALANARTFGHVFDPLTTYFAITPEGRLPWVILEIHNTYGERHAHVVRLDARGRAEVDKAFYVSPFLTVEGIYAVAVTLTPDRVGVAITLRQNGIRVFDASFTGRPSPLTRSALLRAALTTPLVTHQVSARIRVHGLRLWTRLPVVPRPPHLPPEGLQ